MLYGGEGERDTETVDGKHLDGSRYITVWMNTHSLPPPPPFNYALHHIQPHAPVHVPWKLELRPPRS